MLKVKINKKDMEMLVNPCSVEFISKICYARCCSYSTYRLGFPLIMPIGDEIKNFENSYNSNGVVYDEKLGIIKLKTKKSPAQDSKTNFCNLHNSDYKPFGCKIMPLTLKNNEIKVRSFIKQYYCQKKKFPNVERVPFYIGFRQSMVAVFGENETDRIINQIESGKEEIFCEISQMKLEQVRQIIEIIDKVSSINKQKFNQNV